jgi:predicted  nucleic acid-binding Zn-ribbon protein
MLRKLLELQQLDMKITSLKLREQEIPRQKESFNIQRRRLETELKESEDRVKKLRLEQRDCEGEIEQKNTHIKKFEGQLLIVKKNEEYKALLHEIDLLKKQISLKEERILAIMDDIEHVQMKFQEDKARITEEIGKLGDECSRIDAELAEAVKERKAQEGKRAPLAAQVDPVLLARYERVRKARTPAVVPLVETNKQAEACGGCYMTVRPQVVNEIMAAKEYHSCGHCARILYYPGNIEVPPDSTEF